MGSLALGSTAVDSPVRNLPDTLGEAKFRHAGVLQCLGHLLPCHSTMVTMQTFFFSASSAGLPGCIFATRVLHQYSAEY